MGTGEISPAVVGEKPQIHFKRLIFNDETELTLEKIA